MSIARSKFVGELVTRTWTPDELQKAGVDHAQYDLREELTFISAVHGAITAPAGMVTDYASIPRFAFVYLDPTDPVIEMPSVIHDYLYNVRGAIPGRDQPLTREEADKVLVEAMRFCGAREDQMAAVYMAVRVFGAAHWSEE